MFPRLRKAIWLFSLGLACCLGLSAMAQTGSEKIRVLIIDGQNNHNWKATTPVMKKALEDSGRFTVTVATTPTRPQTPQKPQEPKKPEEPKVPKNNDGESLKKYEEAKKNYDKLLKKYEEAKKDFEKNRETLLKKYEEAKKEADKQAVTYKDDMAKFRPNLAECDVVLSNYNGDTWPKEFQDHLEKSLKSGKVGLVIVHAANNSFGGWVEYNLMIGMGWRGEKFGKRMKLDDSGKQIIVPAGEDQGSGHRYSGPFQITVRDAKHPITKDMPQEWMHYNDELYDNMRGPIENVHLLASAYSKGTKTHEPMIWTVSYGKGRVFHTPMGHDAGSMKCIGFITTLQRGTEWAATGKVTLPIPKEFPTAEKTSTLNAK